MPLSEEEHVKNPLLNIGYGNFVVANRVVAIVTPTSAPMKRLKEDAREKSRLLDATQGRRTRSIIVMDSDHVVLSAVQPETVAQRFAGPNGKKGEDGHPVE
jgi:regulator of extracellular matrix RemA (YlzA/DUF370 family)